MCVRVCVCVCVCGCGCVCVCVCVCFWTAGGGSGELWVAFHKQHTATVIYGVLKPLPAKGDVSVLFAAPSCLSLVYNL